MDILYTELIDYCTHEIYQIIKLDNLPDYIKLPGIDNYQYCKIIDFIQLDNIQESGLIDLSDYPGYPGISKIIVKDILDNLFILIYDIKSAFLSICNHGKVKLSYHEYILIAELISSVSMYKDTLSYNDFIQDKLNDILGSLSDILYPCYTCYSEY